MTDFKIVYNKDTHYWGLTTSYGRVYQSLGKLVADGAIEEQQIGNMLLLAFGCGREHQANIILEALKFGRPL